MVGQPHPTLLLGLHGPKGRVSSVLDALAPLDGHLPLLRVITFFKFSIFPKKSFNNGVGKTHTTSVASSEVQDVGSGVEKTPELGSCSLPSHVGLTKQTWLPGTRMLAVGNMFCIKKSPLGEVRRCNEQTNRPPGVVLATRLLLGGTVSVKLRGD